MTPAQPSSEARTGWIEWMLTALLAVNLGWTTLCLGGYRPETMVVTATLTGAMLSVWLLARAAGSSGGRLHPAGWCLLPFLAYAAWNVWRVAPVRWLGWHDWLWWAQMITIFWIVLNGVRSRPAQIGLIAALVSVALIAVVLAAYQRFVRPDWLMLGRVQADQFIGRASGPFGIPNSLGALLILLIPLLGALTFQRGAAAGQRVLAGYLGVVLLFGLGLTVSRGAWLALALALMGWPLLAWRRRWWVRLGGTMATAVLLVAAGWTLGRAVPLVRERFDQMAKESGEWTRPIMWRGAWRLFRGHEWWGSGAGSYNVLFEKYRPENYQMEPQWAHNDYLNTLSDYGAAGFILFFGAAACIAVIAFRRRNRERAPGRAARGWGDAWIDQGMALGLLAFALQLSVDFHFKIPALAMAFAMVAACVVNRNWVLDPAPVRRMGMGSRIIAGVLALVVVVGLMGFVRPHYRAEARRYAARQTLDTLWQVDETMPAYRVALQQADEDLRQAVKIDAGNTQAWSDLAYATALRARLEPQQARDLGRRAEQFADRALAQSPAVTEFWLRRAVGRDLQNRWFEAGADMTQALERAPNSATVWYFYAYHLALRPVGRAQARSAVALCLRLDPENHAAQVLRQKLATDN
jgi:O-antigen ligase